MSGEIVFYEFAIAILMGLGALAFFVWAVLSGQMDDMEDITHRILEREREDG